MHPKPILIWLMLLSFSVLSSGCGAVFVNRGAVQHSMKVGLDNPDAKKASRKADFSESVCVFVDDAVAAIYPYGGAVGSMSDEEVYSGKAALKCMLNGREYSGVIVATGQAFDIRKARDDGYVLRFYAKSVKGNDPVMVSLVDSNEDGQEVEVSLPIDPYGKLSTEWQKFEIPLKDFPDVGGYYDGAKMVDGVKIKWDRISQYRLKDNRTGQPNYTVFADEVSVAPSSKKN